MTKYEILIDYRTGDSLGHQEVVGESTGIIVTDLAKAKENIKRIKAHHTAYESDGPWDVLILLTDHGVWGVSPFWHGYFETLRKAYIVSSDDKMSFTTGHSI